jgi:hypothetical protein
MEYRQIIVPIALFVCITYAFWVVVQALLRYRMMREPGTEEILQSILAAERADRRLSSLRWGLLCLALSIGFVVLDRIDVDGLSPLAFAVLLGATGLSQLLYFALTRGSGKD